MPTYNPRICELMECDIVFTPTRRDKIYCCIRHCNIAASRNYRAAHGQKRDPAIQIPRRNQARACHDFVRRDTPERWLAYAKQNPIYAVGVLQGETIQQFIGSMFQR